MATKRPGKKRKKSLESPPTTSLSSLPKELILNILARIPKIHNQTLSLVSKTFKSLLTSCELEATRSRIQDILYVCLNLNKKKPKPTWFKLSKQQKLLPITSSFPYQKHPLSPTILSTGSEIYIIGGFVNRWRSNLVFVLDCRSHNWRKLPNMRVARGTPASDVIDGKIYVIGGSKSDKSEDWGEVYNPKTHTTWEPVSETALDLSIQKSVLPDSLVMRGKVYSEGGVKCHSGPKSCLVELDNVLYTIFISKGKFMWRELKNDLEFKVSGVRGLLPDSKSADHHLVAVANHSGGSNVTVWWKTKEKCETKIWCAEISFEKRNKQELWGFIEWSKSVYSFDGGNSSSDFFLSSAIVTP